MGFIVNNLNGSTIFVTADHGFMYQESALDEADRHTVEEGMPGVLEAQEALHPGPRHVADAERLGGQHGHHGGHG